MNSSNNHIDCQICHLEKCRQCLRRLILEIFDDILDNQDQKTASEIGRKGGSESNRNKILDEALIQLFKAEKHRLKNSARSIWNNLSHYKIDNPLNTANGSLFIMVSKNDRTKEILVTSDNNSEKIIKFNTFRRYVSDNKKKFSSAQ